MSLAAGNRAAPHLTDPEGTAAMTEPITRHQDSERRGRIASPAGAPPADPATGRVRPTAWFAGGTSTVAVSFDYSSLVVLELLARRLDRRASGDPEGTRITGVLLVNGGLFADAHSHPWRTTPLLKTRLGGLAVARNQNRPAASA